MNLDSFRKHISEVWFAKLEKFLESKDFEILWNKLKVRIEMGKTIYPYSKRLAEKYPKIQNTIFQPFNSTTHNLLSVIIVDTAPTMDISPVDNYPIARGYAHPESLYDAIDELIEGKTERSYDLGYLNSQGVMLLNCSLTRDESATHSKVWEPFMKYFFNEVLQDFTGLDIVFIGERAQDYVTCIKYPKSHYIHEVNELTGDVLKQLHNKITWDIGQFSSDLPF